MGKQPDAKRKAKLTERRRKHEASVSKVVANQSKAADWIATFDAEPNVIAELVDEQGTVLVYVEGDTDENWTVFVDREPTAGTNDEFAALGWLLSAAVDDQVAGNNSFIRFSPWLLEEIEKRCEAENLDWYEFLRSLLPRDKQHLGLPEHRLG